MAKRRGGPGEKQKSHSPKTKKRLEKKRAMLAAKKKRK